MFCADELPLGQYRDIDTSIHRLDVRVKLILGLILLGGAFGTLTGTLLALLVGLLGLGLGSIPPADAWRWLARLKWFLLFTLLFHALATPGHFIPHLDWRSGGITYEGVFNGFVVSMRLIALLLVSVLLTLTSSPARLVDGLEKLLAPLRRLRLPVQDIAMMIMLSLHFIPMLHREAQAIFRAQVARGLDLQQGGLLARGKQLLPLVVPLIMGAFRRADNLALALQVRRYDSRVPRTSLYCDKLGRSDYLLLLLGAGLVLLAVLLDGALFGSVSF